MERNGKADNLRFLLIFLTVFAHFLECFTGAETVYRVIYSFHMPAFLFLTGYYAEFRVEKVWSYILLYAVFQFLYCRFSGTPLQFSTPYWLLWYLFLQPIYLLILPVFQKQSGRTQRLVLCLTVPAALLAGCFRSLDYDLSLSRLFVFLPFYLAGYYAKNAAPRPSPDPRWTKYGSIALAAAAVLYVCLREQIPVWAFYGARCYAVSGYGALTRLTLLLTAAAWLLFLWQWTPRRKLPVVSVLGRRTLWVYLFHGFFVLVLKEHNIFTGALWQNLLLAAGLSFALVLAFGNPYVAKALNRLTALSRK